MEFVYKMVNQGCSVSFHAFFIFDCSVKDYLYGSMVLNEFLFALKDIFLKRAVGKTKAVWKCIFCSGLVIHKINTIFSIYKFWVVYSLILQIDFENDIYYPTFLKHIE